MNNFDGYFETPNSTSARGWRIALQALGYGALLNTETEADAIHDLLSPSPVLLPEPLTRVYRAMQPEYTEARRVADNFNFDNVDPIQF